MRLKPLLLGMSAGVLLLGSTVPARAQGGCQSEVERFCSGEKQVLACLKKNRTDLSPGCATYVGLFDQIPSCLQEARQLCPTDAPSVQSVTGCLRGHADKLSAECKAEIDKIR
ncbi:MAG: cysteine rich repeat-containing protein [Candidatus Binatia bacterium]